MGQIPRSKLRLGSAVATSVSEWKHFHSLTLVATSEMKRTWGEIGTDVFWLNAPELAPGMFTVGPTADLRVSGPSRPFS